MTAPEGLKVKVTHLRAFKAVEGMGAATIFTTKMKAKKMALPFGPDPKGGHTMVELVDGDGNVIAAGEARCSPKDNYSKQMGRQIALGRAIKSIPS